MVFFASFKQGYFSQSLLFMSLSCSCEGLGSVGSKKSTHSLANTERFSAKNDQFFNVVDTRRENIAGNAIIVASERVGVLF